MAVTSESREGSSENQPSVGEHNQPTPSTEYWSGARTDMPEQLGLYRIKKKLGGGGMGAVYLVENSKLQREEALKVPHFDSRDDPSVRERFLREARAAARLDHPNLCPIYDADVIEGIWFLTMRLLPGKPLSAWTVRPHPAPEAIKIVTKLAQALEHAHSQGIIHRDLKPSNIMMCPGTGPTVMDFGLAKQTLHTDQKLTQTGTTLGTPAYMPPEQVKGELDLVCPASDVYSLGVILFQLLTGRLPFEGTLGEVMGKVLFVEAPVPSEFQPGLSPALDALCRKAMAKAPEARYPSMKAFAAELIDMLHTIPATAATPTPKKETYDLHDKVTMIPDKAPVSARPPERKEPPIPPVPSLDPTAADDPKARRPGRKRQAAPTRTDAAAQGALRWWVVVGLSLVLLMVIGLAGAGFWLLQNRGAANKNEFVNSIEMKLMFIRGGTFLMGSPKEEAGRDVNEEQQHPVEVSEFYLGAFEVTQKQFRQVMGYNPSHFSTNAGGKEGVQYTPPAGPGPGGGGALGALGGGGGQFGLGGGGGGFGPGGGRGPMEPKSGPFLPGGAGAGLSRSEGTEDYPVENVSWEEAREFCEKLTGKDTKKPAGWRYRLPREAEWEYACRGGAPSYQVFHFGNSLLSTQANFDGNFPYGGSDKGVHLERTCRAGSHRANGFGLYDMHGNVWEWCHDWHGAGYYGTSPLRDPQGPPDGINRVIRGGGVSGGGQDCRSACRRGHAPANRSYELGFRVALVPWDR
jgi:formylglycine-generating enzyme required for sulfatase activity/serine/threonine protein kinase